jgi:steroid delta-isomerase-like uncharacterized protein
MSTDPAGTLEPVTVDGLLDAWERAWTRHDATGFDPVCVSGVRYEDPFTSEPLLGVTALARHARTLWSAFPDARVERAGARLTDGTFVAAPFRLTGTHRGELSGLPPSGREVSVVAVAYCELRHGRLAHIRVLFDAYDAAVSLGLLPQRGSLGEKALLALRGFGLRGR